MAHIRTEELNENDKERLAKNFTSVRHGTRPLIRMIPGNYILPKAYERYKDAIYNLEIRPEDTFVITWPKNGTTWTLELVWCLQNNIDLDTAKRIPLSDRCPFLDSPLLFGDYSSEGDMPFLLKDVDDAESPRIIKCHLPFDVLPVNLLDKAKVFICLRNPKDMLVSYFHHAKLFKSNGYEGDFPTFFDLFMDDILMYSSYWKFTLAAWELRNHPSVCLLFFEDMKNDLASCLRKAAQFLGRKPTEEQLEKVAQHLDFKNMKVNNAVIMKEIRNITFSDPDAKFMRKGEIGDWKNYFTDEMNERMNKAIEKHFKDSGLSFIYE